MYTNALRLVNAGYGILAEVDVTNSRQFAHVVEVIFKVRKALCNRTALREPFLDLLLSLYSNQNTSSKIKKRSASGTSNGPPSGSYLGNNGNDESVQISFPLVQCWHETANSLQQPKFTVDTISAVFITAILRELAHQLVVYWSRRTGSTPEEFLILSEAGDFIERKFLGGVLEGWWEVGYVGAFTHLEKITIETDAGQLYVLNDAGVSHILNGFKFTSTSPQLPLLQTLDMASTPPPSQTNIVREKIATIERGAEDEPQKTPSYVTPAFVAGLGLVRQSPMAGDKFIL